MNPLKYEALRDAQRLAAEQQERRGDAERPARAAPQPERAAPEIDRDKIQAQARYEVALERAKRHQWQTIAFKQRQKEAADKRDLEERSEQYMKANDPKEYARLQRDKRVRAELAYRDNFVKQPMTRDQAARQGEKPGREQSESSREKGDAGQPREGNKWQRNMSERARAAAEITQRQHKDREDHVR
jgi:hypothetical protein